MNEAQELVKENDYVIIQKQNYTKIHKVKKIVVTLGKDEVDISSIVGEPFWTTYKMEPKANSKRSYVLKKSKCAISISGKFKFVVVVKKCTEIILKEFFILTDEIIKDITSGVDNREIIDDGSSQKLSTQEIISLREGGMSAQNIVSQLIENSKTFFNKTEYSQVSVNFSDKMFVCSCLA